MYVSGLDRPWLDTPFSLQGFMIQNEAQIKNLSLFCDYVFIDEKRSITQLDIDTKPTPSNGRTLGVAATSFKTEIAAHHPIHYTEQTSVTTEIRDAHSAYQNIRDEFDNMASQIGRAHV